MTVREPTVASDAFQRRELEQLDLYEDRKRVAFGLTALAAIGAVGGVLAAVVWWGWQG